MALSESIEYDKIEVVGPYKKDPVNAGGQYGHPQVTNVGTSTHMQWSLVYQAA